MIRPAWVGRTLLIGAGIIAFANVIALGGVVYDRVGTPESELRLSSRELNRIWNQEENSGMSVSLRVQYPADTAPPTVVEVSRTRGLWYGTTRPYWFDAAKLKEIGYPVPESFAFDSVLRGTRSLRREALFVLELDGPAYHRRLDRTRAAAASADSASAARPKDSTATSDALRARNALEHLERVESRLFVVDAGRDLAALRARYPDREHYAIVWGSYRAWIETAGKTRRLVGEISGFDPGAMNVPHRFRGAIVPNEKPSELETSLRPATVTVALGKRLEPWIVSAEKP